MILFQTKIKENVREYMVNFSKVKTRNQIGYRIFIKELSTTNDRSKEITLQYESKEGGYKFLLKNIQLFDNSIPVPKEARNIMVINKLTQKVILTVFIEFLK